MKIYFLMSLSVVIGSAFAGDIPKPVPAHTLQSISVPKDAGSSLWVLVATFMVARDSGGMVGVAFQEFSSNDRCEAAKALLPLLSAKHDAGFGGKATNTPMAQCIPK